MKIVTVNIMIVLTITTNFSFAQAEKKAVEPTNHYYAIVKTDHGLKYYKVETFVDRSSTSGIMNLKTMPSRYRESQILASGGIKTVKVNGKESTQVTFIDTRLRSLGTINFTFTDEGNAWSENILLLKVDGSVWLSKDLIMAQTAMQPMKMGEKANEFAHYEQKLTYERKYGVPYPEN